MQFSAAHWPTVPASAASGLVRYVAIKARKKNEE